VDEIVTMDNSHEVNVWTHEGKVWLTADALDDRVTVVMTPAEAQKLIELLQWARVDLSKSEDK
jgi:hypothetical protein